MKGKTHSTEEIIRILGQADGVETAQSVCREHNISEQTFYRWKKKFGGMGVKELRRLKSLEDENRRLKSLVADLSREKQILQNVLSKEL